MVGKHVLSVIFLGLVSAHVTQASIFPLLSGFWHQDHFPQFLNFLDMPGIGQYSRNLASSMATAASNFYGGFRRHFGNWQPFGFNISPRFRLLHRFINGGILPGITQPAIINGAADTVADSVAARVLPENYLRPTLLGGRGLLGGGLLGNYGRNLDGVGGVGGVGGGSGAASAAASAA